MEIGIDLDDTLVMTCEQMLKYGDIFNKEKYGENAKRNEVGEMATHHYLSQVYDWDEETKFEFFDKYYKNILEECEVKEFAIDVVKKLKEMGHKVFFISARLENIKDCDAEKITIDMLEKYDIPYDELIIGAYKKVRDSQKRGVDIFVDDSLEHCVELSKSGIKTYLITSVANKSVDTGDIERVDNWKELSEKMFKFIEENKDIIECN